MRAALSVLERSGQYLELCVVGDPGQTATVPSDILLLQAEFDFEATALPDRLATNAWLATAVANRQLHELILDLQPAHEAGAPSTSITASASSLRCHLVPALLHEEVAEDVLACVCHRQPVDGRHVQLARLAPTNRVMCPVSNLELDARDLQRVGCVGRFLWPRGSLAAAAEPNWTRLRHAENILIVGRRPRQRLDPTDF